MKQLHILLCMALLAACTAVGTQSPNPVLSIEGGQIQGIFTNLPGVYVYRGIPYAAAPLGDLRWKEPQPVVPWEGVKIADRFGHPSYQSVHYPGGYASGTDTPPEPIVPVPDSVQIGCEKQTVERWSVEKEIVGERLEMRTFSHK